MTNDSLLLGQKFKFARHLENVPGWELSVGWFTTEGLPIQGILCLAYYSGQGLYINECVPLMKLRQGLTSITLASSSLMCEEDELEYDTVAKLFCGNISDVNAMLKEGDSDIEWNYLSNCSSHK